jgi:REP element-mobilizing transposase RayT
MAHSYVSQLLHCVFSTKERRRIITPDLQLRLLPYMGGIARDHKFRLLHAGGVDDHVHLLLSLARAMSIAKAMQLIKAGSSKWVHNTFPEHRSFEWQEGYGAFSISISDKQRTIRYIDNQREHHKKVDFKTEYLSFLDAHEIEYDIRHVFD